MNLKLGGQPSTEHEEDPSQDPDYSSSLARLAQAARSFGGPNHPEDRARLASGVAKQFYGLDAQGKPALGGRAWTQSQGGTPAGILDQFASLPNFLAPVAGLAAKYLSPGGRGLGSAGVDVNPPQFSQDAAERLRKLDAAVSKSTDVGEAHTLPEHLEDAAAMLASPFPASKVAGEAKGMQRAFEALVPVRPPTLGRYLGDTAMLGGGNASLDAVLAKLSSMKKGEAMTSESPDAYADLVDPNNSSESQLRREAQLLYNTNRPRADHTISDQQMENSNDS